MLMLVKRWSTCILKISKMLFDENSLSHVRKRKVINVRRIDLENTLHWYIHVLFLCTNLSFNKYNYNTYTELYGNNFFYKEQKKAQLFIEDFKIKSLNVFGFLNFMLGYSFVLFWLEVFLFFFFNLVCGLLTV